MLYSLGSKNIIIIIIKYKLRYPVLLKASIFNSCMGSSCRYILEVQRCRVEKG
jgi:hypothetical protein